MKQQTIQIQKPLENTNDGINIPKTTTMVRAATLLEPFEQKIVPKTIGFFTVVYNEQCYLVKPHDMVPSTATIQRTKQNHLMGFDAIVSG